MENLIKIFPKDIWNEIVEHLPKKVYVLRHVEFNEDFEPVIFGSKKNLINYIHNFTLIAIKKGLFDNEFLEEAFNLKNFDDDKILHLKYPIPENYGKWRNENVYGFPPYDVCEFHIEEVEIM